MLFKDTIDNNIRLWDASNHDDEVIQAILGFLDDDTPVALLPCARGGYSMMMPQTATSVHVGAAECARLKESAYCFYRPLPQRKLHLFDLALFTFHMLDKNDYAIVFGSTLLSTLLGLISPVINQIIFGPVVESGTESIISPITALLLGVSISQLLLGTINSFVMSSISTSQNSTCRWKRPS